MHDWCGRARRYPAPMQTARAHLDQRPWGQSLQRPEHPAKRASTNLPISTMEAVSAMTKRISVPAYYETRDGSFLGFDDLIEKPALREELLPSAKGKLTRAIRRIGLVLLVASNDN